MKIWYWICEMFYKLRLRRAYYFYNCMRDKYDCGHSRASYINPKVELAERKCNSLYEKCVEYKEKREKL